MTPRATTDFIDSETTDLDLLRRRPWNIAVILRRPGEEDGECEEIMIDPIDTSEANLISLQMGHFYERHPSVGGDPGEGVEVMTEAEAARWLLERVKPDVYRTDAGVQVVSRHLVGAIPSFDAVTFDLMFRRHGLCWPAHYHIVDVEAMIVGWLASVGTAHHPPYNSTDLSLCMGVNPEEFARHTAGGDAKWARALYDAAMSPSALVSPAALAAAAGGPGR